MVDSGVGFAMIGTMPPPTGGSPPHLPTADVETDIGRARRARSARRVVMGLIVVVVVVALTSFLGPHTTTISGSGNGYRLTLTYPSVTRPGLAVRWVLEVRHPGGFDGKVTIATTSRYFDLFDFNNLDPVPSSQTTDGTNSIWVFDPPPGDVLTITMDARLEPAQQYGKSAVTELRLGGLRAVVLHYSTRVMP